ncbi:TRAP transporter substrate-binding protein [Paracoccus sp. TK19116]|uniref:TRAP transporter substrate-binding protein n=2 Tax=Paracoccus albicereus TaxID=2922394 RepID=A0ABT1MQZ9_9RHOB|nr:TRAP transporter substrate-binding protein [Paracoccus albicereus]MCQ0970631.1 TRAP transporter substrate-binding protein [Paracoccus albicereus]
MTIRTLAASTCVAAGLLAPLGAAAKELKFANFSSPQHTITASVTDKLNEAAQAGTNGELTVRSYDGGELGSGPADQYVRVVQGVADIAWGLPGYTSSQFPKTMIVEMPDALPLDQPAYPALWRAYDDNLASEFPGVKPLALWGSEPNIFIMKDKQVRTPADLAGLKIRVAGASAGEAIEALGATPVQMPMTQVYNGLQTGLIDGAISGASTLIDFKLDEVADSYTLGANLGRLVFFTVMSQSVYDGLSDEEKAAIDSVAGEELSKSAEEAWIATADQALDAARADDRNTVIDLSDEEIAAFTEALAPVTDAYVEAAGGADALAAMRGE